MNNSIASLSGPPVAPNPNGDMGQRPLSAGPQQDQGPQIPPAPSHNQTVAALRHFRIMERELTQLLRNPDLGKSDCKMAIIAGATKLVGDRIMQPNEAVQQLSSVPDKPFEQRQWVEQHLVATIHAAAAVLDHHRMAFAGRHVQPAEPFDPDDHLQLIGSLQSHYNSLRNPR